MTGAETLPDIPRVLTAVAEWSACVVYLAAVGRRAPWARLVAVCLGGLGALVAVQVVAGRLPLPLWAVGMASAVTVMLALTWRAGRLPLRAAGYLTARALVLAELVASLHWQLHCFFFPGSVLPTTPAQVGLVVLLYGAGFALAWALERRTFPWGTLADVGPREIAQAAAIALATFFMSNLSFLGTSTPFTGRLGPEVFYIRTLVDLCGLVALHAQQGQRLEAHARAEVRAVDGVLRAQHEQYLQSKRSIEAVQRTYHDLKHQIAVVRAEDDPARRQAHLDEIEHAIRGHGTYVRTGNQVLDVVLTTKKAMAVERGVELTCVADGSLLDFVSVVDICSVLGNALDNAVEAAGAVPAADERLVRLALFAQGDLVMVVVENRYHGHRRVEQGRFATTKADRARHGWGLKSIAHTAEKYDGSVTTHAADGWFTLRILLPRPTPAGAGRPGASAAVTP